MSNLFPTKFQMSILDSVLGKWQKMENGEYSEQMKEDNLDDACGTIKAKTFSAGSREIQIEDEKLKLIKKKK